MNERYIIIEWTQINRLIYMDRYPGNIHKKILEGSCGDKII